MLKKGLGIIASLVVAGGVILVACGDDGDGCGNPPVIAGDWSGTLVDSSCGNGNFGVTFVQSGCAVTGIWSADFTVPACDALGSLEGGLDGSTLDVTLNQTGDDCRVDVNGVVSGANQITGTYTQRGGCEVIAGGTLSIQRNIAATATPGNATATPNPTSTPSPSPTP